MILHPLLLEAALQQPSARGYRSATPFPHAVIQGAFPPEALRNLANQFPPLDSPTWHISFNAKPETKKHASTDLGAFHPDIATSPIEFGTAYFVNWLERLTGISGLIPDPYFIGGGLHMIERGGWLNVHTDFNRHPTLRLDRRLNVLLYLNDGWQDEWGGHLCLFDNAPFDKGHPYKPTTARVKVRPELGTMVVFDTSPWSFHGHPEPLTCPEGVTRKSIALYYYTNGRPEEEMLESHSTIFFEGERA